MSTILLPLLFFVLIRTIFVRTVPITLDETEDIRTTLARLHRETDKVRRRLNPMPDVITFASNDVANRLKRYVHTKSSDTAHVNLKIDSEEDVETKYINLYVDTRHPLDVEYTGSDDTSDYLETKIVYLDIDTILNARSYPPYRRFRRHRRIK